jgi:hypothetical protein
MDGWTYTLFALVGAAVCVIGAGSIILLAAVEVFKKVHLAGIETEAAIRKSRADHGLLHEEAKDKRAPVLQLGLGTDKEVNLSLVGGFEK